MRGEKTGRGKILPPGSTSFQPVETCELLAPEAVAGYPEARSDVGGDVGPAGSGGKTGGQRDDERMAQREELERWAEQIVRDAREEAERILAAAHETAQAKIAEAVREEVEKTRKRLNELLEKIGEEWERVREEVSRQTATLAIEIARKIIREELQARPEAVVKMAREAVARIGGGEKLRVVVSGAAAEALKLHMGELEHSAPNGNVEIVSDEALELGDVIVQSSHGEIDARIETQLARLKEEIGASGADEAMLKDGEWLSKRAQATLPRSEPGTGPDTEGTATRQ
ncbi:MAG: hypothetical protein H5T86_00470 [Armatimonadetes bacterium]|nr:hypothetical protein [Armatimonadota bacterium]